MYSVSGPVNILAKRAFIGLNDIEGDSPNRVAHEKNKTRIPQDRRPGRSPHAMHDDTGRGLSGPFPGIQMDFGTPFRKPLHQHLGEALRSAERVVSVTDESDSHGSGIALFNKDILGDGNTVSPGRSNPHGCHTSSRELEYA
jgi:hypothetical protein